MAKIDNSHGSYKSYIIGFVLSILLTFLAYFLVVQGKMEGFNPYVLLGILASLQFIVQLIFFLHLASEEKPRWNLQSFVFTFISVVILVVGSLWVMYSLDYNMMTF